MRPVLLMVTALAGCAYRVPSFTLLPSASDGVGLLYVDGRTVAASAREKSTVGVLDSVFRDGDYLIHVIVVNRGDAPFAVVPSEFVVLRYRGNLSPIPLDVYSPQQYVLALRERANRDIRRTAMAVVYTATNAGSTSSTTVSAAEATSIGGESASGIAVSSTKTENPDAQAEALGQGVQLLSRMRASAIDEIANVADTLLVPDTLGPGEAADGMIAVAAAQPPIAAGGRLIVQVEVAGELHELHLVARR